MEKITKTFDVYDFDELDKEIQNKLIEQEKANYSEDYCNYSLYDDMKEKAKELLEKYFKGKAEFKNIYYSLSYCQGDGAMIEFTLNYCNKIVNVKQYGNYYHERSFIIESYELSDKQEEQLKEKIYKMNCELANYGWKQIETTISDEEAKENLRQYKYFKNGKYFN